MEYHPNAFARGLVQDKSGLVGVFMARVDNHFYPHVLEELGARLRATGRQMLFFTHEADGDIDETLRLALQYRVDAMLLTAVDMSSQMVEVFERNNIPTILFNRTLDNALVASVVCDNERGGEQVAEYLLRGGHERFAFIGGAPGASTNLGRKLGFLRHLRHHGIEDVHVLEDSYTYAWGREAANRLLQESVPPDAVFCASDLVAFGFIDGVHFDLGRKIPEDVAVVGFDDTPTARWASYNLTTIRQDVGRMVSETIAILDDAEERAKREIRIVPSELVVRGTTRTEPRDKATEFPTEPRIP